MDEFHKIKYIIMSSYRETRKCFITIHKESLKVSSRTHHISKHLHRNLTRAPLIQTKGILEEKKETMKGHSAESPIQYLKPAYHFLLDKGAKFLFVIVGLDRDFFCLKVVAKV